MKKASDKQPTNLTLNKRVLERAADLMSLRGYSSLSVLVEDLIRDEYDRRCGPVKFPDRDIKPSSLNEPPSSNPPTPPTPEGKPPPGTGVARILKRQRAAKSPKASAS